MAEKIEVKHTGGIGAFFYGMIPTALGCAALAWLAFANGCVEFSRSATDYQKKQTYEGRREQRVGVNGEILSPVDLVFKPGGCVKIERAFLDTQTLTIYIHNTCPTKREFIKYSVSEKAPDGTTVATKGEYLTTDDGDLESGETFEEVVSVSADARVTKIIVSTNGGRPE